MLEYAAKQRLHITCTPAEVKKVTLKLTEFRFEDMYFRMQFRNSKDEVLATATSKDEEGHHIYAVKPSEMVQATAKILPSLLEFAKQEENKGNIFCFLEPSPEPEQITLEKLMSNGHSEEAARGFLGDWDGYQG